MRESKSEVVAFQPRKPHLPKLQPGDEFREWTVVRRIHEERSFIHYEMMLNGLKSTRIVTLMHSIFTQDPNFPRKVLNLQDRLAAIKDRIVAKLERVDITDYVVYLVWEPVEPSSLDDDLFEDLQTGTSAEILADASSLLEALTSSLLAVREQGMSHQHVDAALIYRRRDNSRCIIGVGIYSILSPRLIISIQGKNERTELSTLPGRASLGKDQEGRNSQIEETHQLRVLLYKLLCGEAPQSDVWMPAIAQFKLPYAWKRFVTFVFDDDACIDLSSFYKKIPSSGGSRIRAALYRSHDLISAFFAMIPVRSGVRHLGSQVTTFYQVSCVLILGLFFVLFGLRIEAIQNVLFQLNPFIDIREVPSSVYANVSVQVLGIQPTLWCEGQEVALNSHSTAHLKVKPGRLELTAKGSGMLSQDLSFNVNEESQLTEIIKLLPLDEAIYLNVQVPVVVVTEDGSTEKLLGRSFLQDESLQQVLLLKTWFDQYSTVELSSEGYQTMRLKLDEVPFGQAERFEVALVPQPGSIYVTSPLDGVSIVLDGEVVGVTPMALEDLESLHQYNIELMKEGYETLAQTYYLKPNEDAAVEFSFLRKENSGDLLVHLSSAALPDHMTQLDPPIVVEIDGVQMPAGALSFSNIATGRHRVSIHHPLFETIEQTVEVVNREQSELSFNLSYRPPVVEVVLDGDYDYKLLVNETPVVMSEGEIVIAHDEPVLLSLLIQNYYTMTRNVRLSYGEKLVWNVQPVPLPAPEPSESFVIPYLGINMCWIPPGSVQVGSEVTDGKRRVNELVAEPVEMIHGYWMAATEISCKDYEDVSGVLQKYRGHNYPVVYLTWDAAAEFCAKLNASEQSANRLPAGYTYRLPTELEWEYAARAGGNLSFGNQSTPNPNASTFFDTPSQTYGSNAVSVGQPNQFGLLNMLGNVSEWTIQSHNSRPDVSALLAPESAIESGVATVKGGNWTMSSSESRLAYREGVNLNSKSNTIGFRVVLAPSLDTK
jgi:formylglycine-generating enzyme required for sulfatase activity